MTPPHASLPISSRSRRRVASADGNSQVQGHGPARSIPRACTRNGPRSWPRPRRQNRCVECAVVQTCQRHLRTFIFLGQPVTKKIGAPGDHRHPKSITRISFASDGEAMPEAKPPLKNHQGQEEAQGASAGAFVPGPPGSAGSALRLCNHSPALHGSVDHRQSAGVEPDGPASPAFFRRFGSCFPWLRFAVLSCRCPATATQTLTLRVSWPLAPVCAGLFSRAALDASAPNIQIWALRDGLGSMLFAPVLYSLRTDSLIRANDAINGMTLEQLRAGIL